MLTSTAVGVYGTIESKVLSVLRVVTKKLRLSKKKREEAAAQIRLEALWLSLGVTN